ncbi:single-stranded-DNA-specific exonuclease RecJ [Polynucleobacter kasalickyi]|uniref:Single-stranded-DNA-specific exonuclease RecJ n=1 Tax=Polynucleobacter kasalickyi TaxID=1938817 RepID=A0A1W1Y8Y9_9BURK|nr:single-stranded-DNA-specific exonuclease RecJ [Polynucleobacter kasalickyi]SMC32627.1 exonuclease RecJ [Polynucleobacter kasalickyi]
MQLIQRHTNQTLINQFIESGVDPIMARLWTSRGVERAEDLALETKHLLPPTALKGCIEAAKYLLQSIQAHKNLLIVADYDCDGATACAVGLLGLQELGKPFNISVDFLVPNRFTMGYGLTPEVVEMAAKRTPRPDILITVDNGIASIAGVAHAKAMGMEVLVTDHHLPADETPDTPYIVNPNQRGCQFPSKALAGVGVMFYVLLALRKLMREDGIFTPENQPKIEELLDFVALGTVADVASLDRNNRILVSAGLKRMRAQRMHPGIAALFTIADRKPEEASTFDLGFGLGPRLNAAGRLADMTLGIRCLIAKSSTEALTLASELDRMNRDRRTIEAEMKETALDTMAEINVDHQHGLTLFDASWHQGVIGILASRLKEKYHRPVIIFAPAEETMPDGSAILKGSGRSISGFHLRDALDVISKKFPDMILKFGGHSAAAGLSISHAMLEPFCTAFEVVAKEILSEDALQRTLMHDGELPAAMIAAPLVQTIANQVWGQGFPEPVFTGRFKVLKQSVLKNKHLKLELQPIGDENTSFSTNPVLAGIWFHHHELISSETRLAYRLQLDNYLSYPRVQLMIEAEAEEI